MQFIRSTLESDLEIQQLKQINNERLRNAFEDIIDKYARDFTEVGDEISLETGEIVVNNGHIERMQNEQDTGDRRRRLLTNIVNEVHRPIINSATQTRAIMYRQSHSQYEMADEEEAEDWEDLDDLSPSRSERSYAIDSRNNSARYSRRQDTRMIGDNYDEDRRDRISTAHRDESRAPSLLGRQSTAIPDHVRAGRAESSSYQSPQVPYTPRNPLSVGQASPNVNREMVREFAQDIANQITEFMFYFAGSMQQSQQNQQGQQRYVPQGPPRNPPISSRQSEVQANDTYYDEDEEYDSRPPKRRRTFDVPPRAISIPHSEPATSRTQPRALASRTNHYRSEIGNTPTRSQHGHRALTPGMPSLWSGEEDSDHVPSRRVKRQLNHGKTQQQARKAKPVSTAQPQSGSRLRNEIRNTSDPGSPVDIHEQPQNNVLSPLAKKTVASTTPTRQPNVRAPINETQGITDDMQLLPVNYDDENEDMPIVVDSDEDEFLSAQNDNIDELNEEEQQQEREARERVRQNHPRFEFTEADDRNILQMREDGLTWAQIAEQLPHSANQIMYRYRAYLSKGLTSGVYKRKGKITQRPRSARQSASSNSKSPAAADIVGDVRTAGLSEEYNPSDEEYDESRRPTSKHSDQPAVTQQDADAIDELIDPQLVAHPKPKPRNKKATIKEISAGSPTLLSGLEVPPVTQSPRRVARISDPARRLPKKGRPRVIEEPEPAFAVNPQNLIDAKRIELPEPTRRENWRMLAFREPPYFRD